MTAHAQLNPVAQAAATVAQPASDFEQLLQRRFTPADLMQGDTLDKIERIAQMLSKGTITTPEHLRNKIGDCMAIVTQAMFWDMDPFIVAQKTHLVSGKLGYEAQLVNAVLQNSGAVRGLPHYEYRGDGNALECRVGFVPRGSSEIVWNEFLKISDVLVKNSPLWKSNPRQQMGYLQIKNWARAYAPGAILGVYTVDELEDSAPLPSRGDAPAAPAPAPKPALPAYAAADFEKNLPAWRDVVESGKKTAEGLLATLSTRAAFSDEQRAQILALGKVAEAPAQAPAPAAAAPATAAPAGPTFGDLAPTE